MFTRKAQQPAYEPSHDVLQQLNRLQRPSRKFPDRLIDLLSREEYEDPSFFEGVRGEDRSWLIEYLDNSLSTLDPIGPTYQKCLRELQRICNTEERLPRSYTLDVSSLVPIAGPTLIGPYEIVSEGSLDNSKVCAKKLNSTLSSNWRFDAMCFPEEILRWKRLVHPNIARFFGITDKPIHIVSAWISGEKLTKFTTDHPETNRLDLLIGIANGLDYLHSREVFHGDLGGPNIIVEDSGRPYITEFGLTGVFQMGLSTHICRCTRWAEPGFQLPWEKADVFSFAMVMVEVFTDQVPFFTKSDSEARSAVERGERPERPTHVGLTDSLWELVEQCWHGDPGKRPEVSVVTGVLRNCRGEKIPVAPTDWFLEITNEILDLTDQLASVALFGTIGVGKSFVARTILDHDRTKTKFGEHRHFMRCDDLPNSLEGFIQRLSDTIHVDATELESHLQSSPPLILLLDGVDCVLDSLAPEAEEVYAMIEEFGRCEHVCLITTSRIYPDIHGFHRVEVSPPPEGGARDIFYSLCTLTRSPAVDTLIATLGSHPFSIELIARYAHENNYDEQMLLRAWDDQKGVLKTRYYQSLKDVIEPIFCSPRMKELGTVARGVLGAIASYPFGVEERQLEGIFRGAGGVGEVVDVLCKFSLVYRRDKVLKMLMPLQLYFLESMIVYAKTEEVVRWGPECMPAQGVFPSHTCGPPDDWLLDPSPFRPTIPHPGKSWIRRLPKIIKKRLLALFGRRIAPIIRIDLQDPADIPLEARQGDPTNNTPTAAQEDPANILPTSVPENPANPPLAVQGDPSDTSPVVQGDLANTSPAATEEDLANPSPATAEEPPNLPLTAPQRQIPPEMAAYVIDW